MSRPLRIEFDGAWYHVMNRGIAKRNIYKNDKQKSFFLDLLKKSSAKFKIEFHGYCLMDNHYHLLIHTPRKGLSDSMRYINGIYTQFFNKIAKRDGPLFRGRYKAILIDEDNYLLNVSRYIHRNPVEAKMIYCAEEYKWSSYQFYLENTNKPSWLHTNIILDAIGDENQISQYQKFINQGVDEETRKFYEKKKLPVILGATEFKKDHLQSISKTKIESSLPDFNNSRSEPSIKFIVEQCALYFNQPIDTILRFKPGRINLSRNIAMYLCAELTLTKLIDISKFFNCKSKGSISSAAWKIRKIYRTDKKIVEDICNLTKLILN